MKLGPVAQVSALLRAPLVRCSRPFAPPIFTMFGGIKAGLLAINAISLLLRVTSHESRATSHGMLNSCLLPLLLI